MEGLTSDLHVQRHPVKYSGDLNTGYSGDLKSGLFEGQISNGRALALAIAIFPSIRTPDHSKSGRFCPGFKWFLTKWQIIIYA